MMRRRSFLHIFMLILICETAFVNSRSGGIVVVREKFVDAEILSEGTLEDNLVTRIKRESSAYDIVTSKQWRFSDIASKIKDVIDKIQPDEAASQFSNGFRDIDMNYNSFHETENDMADSPVGTVLFANTFFNITNILKEIEPDMCPLNLTDSVEQTWAIASDIFGFIKEFQSLRTRFSSLPESERLAEAESLGRNGTINDLKDVKTPGGHLLKARLRELAGLYANLPPHGGKLTTLCAVADGTLTYVLRMLFSLQLQSYLADSFYKTGNMEQYNNYFNLLISDFRDVRNLLVVSDSDEPLIQSVLSLISVHNDYMKIHLDVPSDVGKTVRKISALKKIENEIAGIELPLIVEVPEKLMGKPDFEDQPIKTPLGPWQDGANVTYAVQYRHNGMHSRLGDWMDPITVSGEANPILRIRVHPKRFDRLIFRKFNNQKPQLVGVLEDKYQTEFRDVNRDLYDAAARFDKKSLEDAEILINNGADIDAVFEGGRRAIHAAALSDNVKIARKFLIKTGNQTDDMYHSGVNAKDNEGYTPMHLASEAGHRRFVQFLLDSAGDVNAKTYIRHWTPVHIAAERGFVSTVKTLLKSSIIDVNAQDIGGFTPLHRAVSGGIPVLEVLMADSRINPQAKSRVGLTPLVLAAMEEYVDITEALLGNENVKPNSKTKLNMTALAFASVLGNTEIVKQLLPLKDIDVNCKTVDGWTPLHLAIALKNTDVIGTLLSKQSNQSNVATSRKITPLHIAVVTEQKGIVEDLIKHGARIDDRTESGLAPIHLALLHKKFEIFNILIDSGADIQAKSFDGSSLLHFAIDNNKFDIIESLVKKGVDINAKNIITGETPLHTAVRNGYLEVVEILVQHGADVNARNKEGETPLHYVASSSDDKVDILNFLATNGADVDIADDMDRTALHKAVKVGNLAKIESLIRKKAAVDCKDYRGSTPLHMASEDGKASLVRTLLNNHASKDITDNEGRTPLHQAVRNGHESVVRTLVENGANSTKKDHYLQTPLHIAIVHNHTAIFSYLRIHLSKYQIFSKVESNLFSNSPIHSVVAFGRVHMMKDLSSIVMGYDAVDNYRHGYYQGNERRYYFSDLDKLSLLQTAVAAGRSEMVDYLLSEFSFGDARSSLCTAAQYGNTDIFDKIQSRVDSWQYSADGRNSVLCCVNGDTNMMEHLISKGADVNITCPDGLTLLRRSANAGYTDIVRLLLKQLHSESDFGNQKVLQVMTQSGRMDEARTLINQGTVVNSTDLGGVTLLHIMAQSGSLDEVQKLVDRGTSVNITTLKGETPMHFAAKGGKVDIISYLASKNADINAVDTKGRSPLHWALESSIELTVVETLMKAGASVNHKCVLGKTPLHVAVSKHGSLKVILYLISKNAGVNEEDSEGNTPLFDAVRRGDNAIVKTLVEEGADVTILNKYGESPLHYVTAIPNSPHYKNEGFDEDLYKTLNQPAMDMLKYLTSKGAIA